MMTLEEKNVLSFLKQQPTITMAELARHGWTDQVIADLEWFGLVNVFCQQGRRSLLQLTDRGMEQLKNR